LRYMLALLINSERVCCLRVTAGSSNELVLTRGGTHVSSVPRLAVNSARRDDTEWESMIISGTRGGRLEPESPHASKTGIWSTSPALHETSARGPRRIATLRKCD